MAVGNVQIVTWGWYSSVAADTPTTPPESEAITSLGWLAGSIYVAPTTAKGMLFGTQFFPIIPKRFKLRR